MSLLIILHTDENVFPTSVRCVILTEGPKEVITEPKEVKVISNIPNDVHSDYFPTVFLDRGD